MKILLICFAIVLAGCRDHGKNTVSSSSGVVQDDASKMERIKTALPVIDKIFKDHFEKNHFPGLAFGVIAEGKLIYSNAFGVADRTAKSPATVQTDFRIASMSKSFTAMSILKLRDEGKLNLQDPASKYVPEMAGIKYLTKDSQPITTEHLLTMSAGFPEDNPWGDRQLADTDKELIEFIKGGISFSNTPGVEFEYSNLGFGILGKIITVVSGEPYQQYINENILIPLQMNDARWEFTEVPKGQLALGYRWEDDQWKEEALLHDGSFGAMGGLICSVEDFSKYVQFHISAWPPRDEAESPIIKRSSLREMHQLQRLSAMSPNAKNSSGQLCPQVTGYGYGLAFRQDCKGWIMVRHGGGLPGFGSDWKFYPDFGIGIVSLSNLTYGSLGSTNTKALDTLIYLASLKPMTIPPSAILQQRQKEIVQLLSSWPEEKLSVFAENFFLDRTVDSWRKYSAKAFDDSGEIINVNAIQPENQLRGIFIMEGKKKNIEVYFTLTPEQVPLIQELNLKILSKE